MSIFNADGSEVSACGNATRCVARMLLEQRPDLSEVTIRTMAGLLRAEPAIMPSAPSLSGIARTSSRPLSLA
jgi:diaminopimelate epimerase